MSMVELASHDEFSKIEKCLQSSVEETLQVRILGPLPLPSSSSFRVSSLTFRFRFLLFLSFNSPRQNHVSGNWSDNELYSIRNRLVQMTDNVLHKLRLGVDCSGLR